MERLLRILSLAALLLACAARSTTGAEARPRASEYDLKAAFIFNFTRFVEWPTNAFPSTNSPVIIGILGADPFQGALEKIVQGERAQGRPIEVARFARAADLKPVHILFIPRNAASQTTEALRRVADFPTLTVSEIDRFADRGGMIQLFTQENQIRMRIDAEKAREARVNISSKVLRLAQLTRGGPSEAGGPQ